MAQSQSCMPTINKEVGWVVHSDDQSDGNTRKEPYHTQLIQVTY